MSNEAHRDDDDVPASDATSGVRVTPRRAETLAGDGGASARLPNWQDREKDQRPGWEKAKIPKSEWLRAKASNDAALAREAPGSPEFARLMEARMRLHLGPAPVIDFGEISAYKRSVYQGALADDLRREIAEKERTTGSGPQTWRRLAVIVGLLVLVVGVLLAILLQGPPKASVDATAPTGEAPASAAAPSEPAATAPPKPAAPAPAATATTPPATASVAPAPPPAPTESVPARPPSTAKPGPPPKPTATSTGELPFFKAK